LSRREALKRAGALGAGAGLTDANGVAFSRTTDGVLKIVYLNAQKQPGGFFPEGLNGRIR
jgi:hypothetical protein